MSKRALTVVPLLVLACTLLVQLVADARPYPNCLPPAFPC
jgi:hypothetical protein